MKKIVWTVGLMLIVLFACAGCAGNTDAVTIDYGSSALYTTEDINKAILEVKKEFASLQGCTLHTLSYAGDEQSMKELEDYNAAHKDQQYDFCIVLNSSFQSPKHGGGAWTADTQYTWDWIVMKEAAGNWILITYGYA